jgi:hypothetical protein
MFRLSIKRMLRLYKGTLKIDRAFSLFDFFLARKIIVKEGV